MRLAGGWEYTAKSAEAFSLGARYFELVANCFRNLAISSLDGGQFVSQVLQWNTKLPDFSAPSNSSWLNFTVCAWSFGQTISNFLWSLTFLLLVVNLLQLSIAQLHRGAPVT